MQVIKKHIAASGVKAGQWVNCPAEKSCRLKGSRHITEKQFFAASAWMSETGNKTLLKDITLKDIETFLRLPAADLDKWNGKARAHLLKMRGIKNAGAGYDPFVKYTRAEEIKRVKEIMESPQRKKSGVSFAPLTDAERLEKLNSKVLENDTHQRAQLQQSIEIAERRQRLKAQEKWQELEESGLRRVVLSDDVILTVEDFEAYRMEAIENGGDVKFAGATLLEYSDGRPSQVRVSRLEMTGPDDEDLNVFRRKMWSHSSHAVKSRNIRFEMKKKDYENFLQENSGNPKFKIYPQQVKVVQKSFGRETVYGSFDIQGDGDSVNSVWESLSSKKQAIELSTNSALAPRTTKYQGSFVDEPTRQHLRSVYSSLKVASSGSTDRLTLEEQHFIDRARTKYIPELISDYSRVQNNPSVSKEDKDEAAQIFKKQLDLISGKTDSIKKKQSTSSLDSMRAGLGFLEDRVSA